MPRHVDEEQRARQINVRLRGDDRQRAKLIAERLHKEGIPGMLNFEGEPVMTNIIRYLLQKEAERLESA
jgi:NADH/NAD ratio-sensing transcriptional regulator Rex